MRVPVICGPTAGGKTDLGVEVALRARDRFGGPGEVVTADSMQVYRGLDIGTAKPTAEERRGVPHHLIDIVDPTEGFTVESWLRLAEGCIADVRARGGVPVVVGGTHLYIKALLDGLFEGPGADEGLRAELMGMDAGARRAELERVDPGAAARIHRNDVRRTVRALEVYRLTGTPISTHQRQWDRDRGACPYTVVILEWEPGELNKRINARVKQMVERGLVEEVRGLWESGRLGGQGGHGGEGGEGGEGDGGGQAGQGLGYKQLVAHFQGRCTLDEAIEAIKVETRRFAKNQRTWLKRLRGGDGSGVGTLRVEMPGEMTDETGGGSGAGEIAERVLAACDGRARH